MFKKFVSVIRGKKFIVFSSVVLGLLILVFLLVFFNRSTPEKTLKEYINYVSENEYIKAAKLLAENEPEEFITPSSSNPFFYIERISGLKLMTYPPSYASIPFCYERAEVKKVEITEKYIWGEDALLTCIVMYEFTKPGIKGVVPEKKQNMITGKQLIHLKKNTNMRESAYCLLILKKALSKFIAQIKTYTMTVCLKKNQMQAWTNYLGNHSQQIFCKFTKQDLEIEF